MDRFQRLFRNGDGKDGDKFVKFKEKDKFWFPRAYYDCKNCKSIWSNIIAYDQQEKLVKCPKCGTDCAPNHIHFRFALLHSDKKMEKIIVDSLLIILKVCRCLGLQ